MTNGFTSHRSNNSEIDTLSWCHNFKTRYSYRSPKANHHLKNAWLGSPKDDIHFVEGTAKPYELCQYISEDDINDACQKATTFYVYLQITLSIMDESIHVNIANTSGFVSRTIVGAYGYIINQYKQTIRHRYERAEVSNYLFSSGIWNRKY